MLRLSFFIVATILQTLCFEIPAAAQMVACQNESNLRSLTFNEPVTYTFSNSSGSVVNVYWIDYNGSRMLYAAVPNMQSQTVYTFVTHPWVVTTVDGSCLSIIVASKEPRTIDISPPKVEDASIPDEEGGKYVAEANRDPATAAKTCVDAGYNSDVNALAGCWVYQMTSEGQKQVANCVISSGDWSSAAFCMAGKSLSPQGQTIARCAMNYANQPQSLAVCALGPTGVNKEALRLAGCVGANSSSAYAAALCVGGTKLTPEQQVYAECAVATSLQPYAFAACATEQLTINEFEKCLSIGVGGNGCFGKNNFFVKALTDAWHGVSGGPNSVLNRPLQVFGGPSSVFNDPAQIWGGPNSIFNNPGQIWGGPNSLVRNPGQVWGGPNSVVRNPDQILGGNNSFFHKNLGIHF